MPSKNNDLLVELIRDQFTQVNERLDKHYDLFQQHTEKDEKAWERIGNVETDLKVTKRVAYSLAAIATTVASWLGLHK